MGTILIVILALIPVGALPNWPLSKSWGYYSSGGWIGSFEFAHPAADGADLKRVQCAAFQDIPEGDKSSPRVL